MFPFSWNTLSTFFLHFGLKAERVKNYMSLWGPFSSCSLELCRLSLNCRFFLSTESSWWRRKSEEKKVNFCNYQMSLIIFIQNEYCTDISSPNRAPEVIKMFALWFTLNLNLCILVFGLVIWLLDCKFLFWQLTSEHCEQ